MNAIAAWKAGSTNRHVLVPSLKRSGPAQSEDLGRCALLINVARPVVRYLVIVECDEPRHCGMRPLQIWVRSILRVTQSVIIEAVSLASKMLSDGSERHLAQDSKRRSRRIFVDV